MGGKTHSNTSGPVLQGRAPTLADVAREAGVSLATASRVLNGSTRTVGKDNVTRVLRAADKLGYAPNLSAQATARGSTRTVALVVSDIADPYFSSLAAGVLERAEDAGLIVTMAVADRSAGQELRIVTTLRGHRPHVIIIAGSRLDGPQDDLIDELGAYTAAGGRVALISQPGLPFPTVAIDNTGAAKDLALALAGRGYGRFAVIRGPDGLHTSRDRCDGFLAGLAQAGIEEERVLVTEFSEDGGYAAGARLIADGLGNVELLFAVTDVMALGVMRALRDAGLVPGRDIGVAGFDDIAAAMDVDPALTTVRVPLRDMGRRAMDLALSGTDPAEVVWMPTTCVIRGSTRDALV
ncbi:LacI family transcriptional regulator [Kibdelosporangium banguiense]|uniref:LacI family transcriptional regulator n=1 Tax=Kibdelosporangium banguiense TaxID=1365924 RepID=A0ABS4U1Z7_9PSEU|nr:LacI family DNA-binding transcriptional regulator [Kibdelosporangium banguiense]MBP2330687.1 LacI family transcriptional regulator [Kibdelosporangium banguiense]